MQSKNFSSWVEKYRPKTLNDITAQADVIKSLKTVLMVSTDKACAPTNVYGMCKAIAERLVTASSKISNSIKFVGVRYGNVLESRGSIIPLFKHQIMSGDYLSVTHKDMTRFIMTLDQSIDLIEETINNAKSGEIWIPKLSSMRIIDLAEIFSRKFNKPIKVTGIRPGEKLHEDLVSSPESIRTIQAEKHYIISSPFAEINTKGEIFSYSSNDNVTEMNSLEKYLNTLRIFEKNINDFVGRSIEEIDTKANKS
jgi:FlaA1/EpsC-like NDP-sugar epimerase